MNPNHKGGKVAYFNIIRVIKRGDVVEYTLTVRAHTEPDHEFGIAVSRSITDFRDLGIPEIVDRITDQIREKYPHIATRETREFARRIFNLTKNMF